MKKDVLVLFKTHLDIGFTDFASNIVDKYIYESIPKAIKVGYDLKGTDTPFVWTLGSWMVNEALKRDSSGIVDKAIRDGLIVWHALPFTTHTELMNKELFEIGLEISKNLDKRYGKNTLAAKMTDVPGHTIGMVPSLEKYNVKFLHIGVNPATPLPPVPRVFRWKCGDSSVIVMYQTDYGNKDEFDDFIVYFAHTGDNSGPQSASEVVNIYENIKKEYPGCNVIPATLDDVYERVLKLKNIPAFDKEIGDTWIHGAGTDPKKISRYRRLLRYIEKNGADNVDLTDSLILVPEHTWGKDIKTFFRNDKDYNFDEMDKLKDTPMYKDVVKSWQEQRHYVSLAEKQLHVKNDYRVTAPSVKGYTKCDDTNAPQIELSWQLFDNSDYLNYEQTYMRSRPEWAIWDFTKVGLPEYHGGIFCAKCLEHYRKNGKDIYLYRFDSNIEKKYGLPYFWLEIYQGNIKLQWFDKKASRLPQAFWLKFKGFKEEWELNKMGLWIKPKDIVGSPLISAVQKGIRNDKMVIEALDSCLAAPFGRKLLQYNVETGKQDMYFNLYNNIWNTNFPMWYFEDSIFRFKIKKRKQ